MTHRDELERLRNRLRDMGYICNFIIGDNGYIDQIFFDNRLWNPLSFAEKARPIARLNRE